MKRFLQAVVFIMTSILEVHVHASSYITLPESKTPIQLPENCLIESTLCTVRTVDREKFTFEIGATEVVLPPNAVFVRTSSGSGSLVKGHVWVKTTSDFKLETPYGYVTMFHAEALFYHSESQLSVRVLSGSVKLHPRSDGEVLVVQTGFENWFGRVDTAGKTTVGIPKAFDIKTVVMDLAPLQNEGKSAFESKLQSLRAAWTAAVNVASDQYAIVVKRGLANQEEKQREQARAHKQWEAERNHWRQLLWQKNFE